MRKAFLVICAIAASSLPAAGSYKNCALNKLENCADSNELVMASSTRRPFAQAVARFMRGAPNTYIGIHPFSPSRDALDTINGPGDHHDRLPNGSWFFDGFKPHDATERGAALLSGDGAVQAIVLLSSSADSAGEFKVGEIHLRVYSHDAPIDAQSNKVVRDWAQEIMAHGELPGSRLMETRYLVHTKAGWKGWDTP